MTRFSRKHRYNMRRADRILVEHFDGKVSLRRITRSDQVDGFVHEAARITAAGYQGRIGAGIGRPDVQRRILSAAARDGCLRCYLLECAGTAVAYQAGVVCDNVYHLQSTAFMPDCGALSAGQVLLVRVIRDLSDGDVRAIDYGFGDARYKQIYGTESWDEATIYLYGPSFIGSCARIVHRLTGAATRVAVRAGLGDRLKKWSLPA